MENTNTKPLTAEEIKAIQKERETIIKNQTIVKK